MAVLETKHGFLVTLERQGALDTPVYVGSVAEHACEYPVRFAVAADGTVTATATATATADGTVTATATATESPAECPSELLERARLVVRATLKQNASLELPPPRRITRWRPAK